MFKKKKIIFIDIDWTIYSHKDGHIFDLASLEALERAKKHGYLIIICTARPYHSVKQTGLLEIFKPDGMILSNGGYMLYHDKIIYEVRFDNNRYEEIVKTVLKHNLTMEVVEPFDRFLISPKTIDVDKTFETYFEDMPLVKNYQSAHVVALLLFAEEKYDEILQKEFPKNTLYFRFHPNAVDVLDKPHDKGTAIKFALDYFKIKKEDAYAFGDDIGDISMFNEVGTSIALGNAKEEVKEVANYITSEVWNEGVKNALIELKIIKK